MLEKFESVLRLKSSVGIRTYENAAVIEFVREASISKVFWVSVWADKVAAISR